MSNPQELELLSGQRQKGESDKAIQAANDWLRLGAGRTLPALLNKYRNLPQSTAPTTSLDTLQSWSKRFGWAIRATDFDKAVEERKNAERDRVMNSFLALDYQRVKKLFKLAQFLEDQLYETGEDGEYHNVWVPDVKSIGSGESAERVDIERFNNALFEQYRKTLDDIAQEVGGRVKKTDVTTGGEPIKWPSMIEVVKPDDSDQT